MEKKSEVSEPGLRKTRVLKKKPTHLLFFCFFLTTRVFFIFFKKKQDFVLIFKENRKTLFLIVFIASCNIIIFRITQ